MAGGKIRTHRAALIPAALLTVTLTPAVAAQDDDAPSVAQSCLNNAEIRRTTILGDRNIVFVTRSGEIYNNQLPRQCPTLRRRSLVNYPVVGGRLCAGYRVAVLFERTPGDYMTTAICELGNFVPITEDELADLTTLTAEDPKRREPRRSRREAVTTRPVELPAEPAAPAQPAEATEPAEPPTE